MRLGAIASGATEALSESGGTLADAYRHGQYDNGGLAAANKSLVTNAVLNSALNAGLGMFAKHNQAIRNPITRFLSQTGEQVVNELLQEPSQQVIEKLQQEIFITMRTFCRLSLMKQKNGRKPHWN